MFATLAAAALALAPPTAAELRPHFDSGLSVVGDARLWLGTRPGEADFRLVFERAGERRIVAAPVAHGETPTADLGTDSRGGLVAVFAVCRRPRDCDVHAVDVDEPRAIPRPLPFAARRGVDERAPTVDGGRFAWAAGDEVLLRARGRTRRVRRALAPPTKEVAQVELAGRHLAATGYHEDGSDFGAWIVRLDGRTLMTGGVGLSGKHAVGLSFAEGKLGFHVSCPGEPGACARPGGAFRYDPRRRRWEQAPHRVTGDPEGFQLLPGRRALVVERGSIDEVALPFARVRGP